MKITIYLYFFSIEVTFTRTRWTTGAIRREVLRVKREFAKSGRSGKLEAIRKYRELVKPLPTLKEAKDFVDSLPD